MKTLAAILRWRSAHAEPAVLATVVAVTGSASRHVGARMLVTRSGRAIGHISGGCLERDVVAHAEALLAQPSEARLVCYDTSTARDRLLGTRMGCQGQVEVLLQPLAAAPLETLMDWARRRCRGVLATVLRSAHAGVAVGDWLAVEVGGGPGKSPEAARGSLVDLELTRAILERVRANSPLEVQEWIATSAGRVQVAYEHVRPPVRLVIFGAAPVSHPLSRIAAELGWQNLIVEPRRPIAATEYPAGDGVWSPAADASGEGRSAFLRGIFEQLGWPLAGDAMPELERSAAIVLSHDFDLDAELLPALLRLPLPYLGLLGSRQRTATLLDSIHKQHPELIIRAALHAPVGLDLGAETPEEIALATVAEVQACFAEASARPLRDLESSRRRNDARASRCGVDHDAAAHD